jgi:hypothetical protein
MDRWLPSTRRTSLPAIDDIYDVGQINEPIVGVIIGASSRLEMAVKITIAKKASVPLTTSVALHFQEFEMPIISHRL